MLTNGAITSHDTLAYIPHKYQFMHLCAYKWRYIFQCKIVCYFILFDGLPRYISRLSADNFTVVLLLSIKHKINRTFVCFRVRSMIFHLVNTERSISLVAAPFVKYYVRYSLDKMSADLTLKYTNILYICPRVTTERSIPLVAAPLVEILR